MSEGITPTAVRGGCVAVRPANVKRDGIPVSREDGKPDALRRDAAAQPATNPKAAGSLHPFEWNWGAWPARGVGYRPAEHRGLQQNWNARTGR